ncbi:unnamed protein product [Owenia fusiformis]|uniref:Uncharacterized protein n=1 Tax=Owenia fusiformis TaxID=6347 RepID=A0A8J1Y4H1_OWEFU|nr:unnamed protein product [Owenia fusiformis]
MASGGSFAQNQLLKHGWTEGQGLGKDETGIKEAIKVKLKKDTCGVGHNLGDEFSFHWWDHVFNKAASNINVKTTEDGVVVTKKGESNTVSSKKPTKAMMNKDLLYGRFVKSTTKMEDGVEVKEKKIKIKKDSDDDSDSDTDSDDNDNDDVLDKTSKLTDEQLFKKCGGLTANKAARHGLGLNGKLARMEQADKLYKEQKLKKQENSGESTTDESESQGIKKKSKKKKKSKDREDVQTDGTHQVKTIEENVLIETVGATEDKKLKKKKSKKRKHESIENTNDKIEHIENEATNEKSNKKQKKKSKKDNDGESMNNEIKKNVVEKPLKNKKKSKKVKTKEDKIKSSIEDDDLNISTKKKKSKKSKKSKT